MNLFASILFVAFGATLIAFTLHHLLIAHRSKSWPKVVVTIRSADVKQDLGESGVSYRPTVRFSYSVDGKTLEAERRRIGWPVSASQTWADRVVARYPVGSRAVAVIDPRDPSFCVLEPGVRGLLFVSLGFGGLFMSVGICTWLIAIA